MHPDLVAKNVVSVSLKIPQFDLSVRDPNTICILTASKDYIESLQNYVFDMITKVKAYKKVNLVKEMNSFEKDFIDLYARSKTKFDLMCFFDQLYSILNKYPKVFSYTLKYIKHYSKNELYIVILPKLSDGFEESFIPLGTFVCKMNANEWWEVGPAFFNQ